MGLSVEPINIVWLRRDLRIYDHAAFHAAMQESAQFLPLFIFDTDILKHFTDPDDRRLSFIYKALKQIHTHARQHGSELIVAYGSAREIWQKLATLPIGRVFAAEDYEPATRERDAFVAALLGGQKRFLPLKDHLIFSPSEIVSQSGASFKVFTPFSKAWLAQFSPEKMAEYPLNHWNKLASVSHFKHAALQAGITLLDMEQSHAHTMQQMGYRAVEDSLWQPAFAEQQLKQFTEAHIADYAGMRDMVGKKGTSRLSPYLRFGMVSIRDCMRKASERSGSAKWISELIWREFYAMILFHAPESIHTEWNIKYRDKLPWKSAGAHFDAWCNGQTGYPIVDAAMRELTTTGWMHNRARMIVASFLTKDLHIDWRLGEAHFAKYLMDYELASNVGGWQWAASTGTDAQPYFRIFNPILQSQKFDPDGAYIRRFVPEIASLPHTQIHAPWQTKHTCHYPRPIVDHYEARDQALAMFKQLDAND